MDDKKLTDVIERAIKGDVQALGRLYDLFVDDIYGYVFYHVGNREDSEDITSDVFLKVLKGIKQFIPTQVSFKAWLFKIARNTVIDYYRKTSKIKKTVLNEDLIDSGMIDTNDVEIDRFTQQLIKNAIAGLSSDQKDVVVLRFYAGLKINEIATLLGKSEEAIKALQHRALKRLTKVLGGAN